MVTKPNPNRELLRRVAMRLGSFNDECLFVGGTTVGVLLSAPAAPSPRPTFDVEASRLIECESFLNALAGHVESDERATIVLGRLERLATRVDAGHPGEPGACSVVWRKAQVVTPRDRPGLPWIALRSRLAVPAEAP